MDVWDSYEQPRKSRIDLRDAYITTGVILAVAAVLLVIVGGMK